VSRFFSKPNLSYIPSLGLAIAWVSLFYRTSLWWNESSYYTHGWCVPILAVLIFLRRNNDGLGATPTSNDLWKVFLLSIFLFFPTRIIGEPDPFWRLPLWLEMISLSFLTFFYLRLILPGKISVSGYFLTSIYLFSCLPWPAGIELQIIHSLTGWVSRLTAEALLWFGFPAEISANLILVDQKEVVIDQGCSGIRSFQNLFSFSLFFAFYFRHSLLAAMCTIILAFLYAVFFNFLRALSLSLVFLNMGTDTQNAWHDTIGNSFVAMSMLAIFLTGKIFQQKEKGNGFNEGATSSPIHYPDFSKKKWILFLIIALPEIATLSWFAWTERSTPEFTWEVSLGKNSENIPPGIHEVLLYDYGEQGEINFENHNQAWVIHFGYHQDSAAASLCSRNHPPDFCMGYTGIRLTDSSKLVEFSIADSALQFRHYAKPTTPYEPLSDLHVFWCSQPLDSRISHFEFTQSSLWKKARWFLSGKLSYERKVLLVSLRGKRSYKQAQEDLFKTLQIILHPKKQI
jgi:exosortase